MTLKEIDELIEILSLELRETTEHLAELYQERTKLILRGDEGDAS